jgi:hypothetical protein
MRSSVEKIKMNSRNVVCKPPPALSGHLPHPVGEEIQSFGRWFVREKHLNMMFSTEQVDIIRSFVDMGG